VTVTTPAGPQAGLPVRAARRPPSRRVVLFRLVAFVVGLVLFCVAFWSFLGWWDRTSAASNLAFAKEVCSKEAYDNQQAGNIYAWYLYQHPECKQFEPPS